MSEPDRAGEYDASAPTPNPRGLSSAEALARLRRDGPNEVPEPKRHPVLAFLHKFWGLSAWMIELIAIISLVLGKRADFAIALVLLLVNAVLSFLQEERASSAVAALRRRLEINARVLRDGAWRPAPARELVTGDVVRLRSGDFAPADVQILDGALQVDQSALTGESRELKKTVQDLVASGSVVKQGEATALVTATGARTYYGHTTQLVQSAHPKLHVEAVIARVVRWLFMVVAVQVVVAVILALARKSAMVELLPLALILLMSAIPIALPVMFTVSMAVGSIELGRRGVLVTRLSAAEDAANMDVLCADKTGTLTLNRLSLAGAEPQPGFTVADVVRYGGLASNAANQDAIDLALLDAARERDLLGGANVIAFTPFSATTRRTEAVIEESGQRRRVVKGALRTVAEAAGLDPAAISELETRAAANAEKGYRTLAVAFSEADAPLRLVGVVLLHDPMRADSRTLIDELRALGVGVKMLTGDALAVARESARSLGLGTIVRAPELESANDAEARALIARSDGFAEVYPEDKFKVVRSLQAEGHVVGMTGDGVNDAPALRQAEIGVAVSGATDVAKGAASVVLTTEGLSGIVDLTIQGRAIYQRVLTWILNKVSRTILKSGFVVIAFLVTGKFVISALGMVLLVFMTDFAKIALATDRVRPSQTPESWNIGPLVRIGIILGILMLAEALTLLAIGWRSFDLSEGRLQTFAFQTLLFFALFSLVSIRERRPFWASPPGAALIIALSAAACAGLLIGHFGFAEMRPLPVAQTGFIVGFSFVCALLLNDAVKIMLIAGTAAKSVRSVHGSPASASARRSGDP